MFRSVSLIEEIRKRRSLWDTAYNTPSDRRLRAKQWSDVADKLFVDWYELDMIEQKGRIQALKRKWKNIRDYYKKGCRANKRYVYSHMLDFLEDENSTENGSIGKIRSVCCAFCSSTNPSQNLLAFSEKTLRKCKYILNIRKEYILAQRQIILPEEPTEFQRYHAKCYKNFTTLPSKYRTCSSMIKDEPTTIYPAEFSLMQTEENDFSSIKQNEMFDSQTEETFQNESLYESDDFISSEKFLANAEVSDLIPNAKTNLPMPSAPDHIEESDSAALKKEHQQIDECGDADRCFLLSLLPDMKTLDNMQKITFKIGVLNQLKSIMMQQEQIFIIKEE